MTPMSSGTATVTRSGAPVGRNATNPCITLMRFVLLLARHRSSRMATDEELDRVALDHTDYSEVLVVWCSTCRREWPVDGGWHELNATRRLVAEHWLAEHVPTAPGRPND